VWTGTFINRRADGSYFEEEATISPVRDAAGAVLNYVAVKRDVTQERALERQLRQSQKLEAVGQLAAGIAHEINTPMQYAGDSARYLSNCIGGVMHAIGAYEALHRELAEKPEFADRVAELTQVREDADLEFAVEQIPLAVARIEDAIARVSVIVRAMKEFAHPGVHEITAADVNHMLQTTLTVARNEFKNVADVETDFGELPPLACHVSELNQAFLNIVVNAAHAIAERVARAGGRGTIRVRTRAEGDDVVVEIEDDGCGIPEAIRSRVFDPFFTTKAVGKGTGQGLAIARSIVMERHAGALTLRSEQGRGTTFTIRLPVHGEPEARLAA
jgi:signal transduction histidine kinase